MPNAKPPKPNPPNPMPGPCYDSMHNHNPYYTTLCLAQAAYKIQEAWPLGNMMAPGQYRQGAAPQGRNPL